jgi:hypothetical protein
MKSLGAEPSIYDVRTFTYDKALDVYEVGESWANSPFIEDQHKVGICTAISMTMRARKHFGIDFSDDFQYLLQKKFIDQNWREGSSAFTACKVGKQYGFLPQNEWTHTTMEDRKKSYDKYIAKLKAIPDEEINRLLEIAAKYKLQAYAKVKVTPETVASAISETGSCIARFVVGKEWWTGKVEPLRPAVTPISGHLVNITRRKGDSYRIANSWGTDWADGGTAYGLFNQNPPTEVWQVWFADVPEPIQKQIDTRASVKGKILDLLQEIIKLVQQL